MFNKQTKFKFQNIGLAAFYILCFASVTAIQTSIFTINQIRFHRLIDSINCQS